MITELPPRVIIDTDPGIDDMMALFLALESPMQVEGITIVMGNNNDLDILARNACLALTICGRAEEGIKVVKGAANPLGGKYQGANAFVIHGKNGIGEVPVPEQGAVDLTALDHQYKEASENNAAQFLVDTCAKYPGEITIITLGPLTNIAKAIQLSDHFQHNVKSISMMGGVFNGKGNKTPCAEANIANDPKAAKIVFGAVKSITMAPLDVTHQLELKPLCSRLSTLNDAGYFLHRINEHYIKWQAERQAESGVPEADMTFPIHDSCAVMALLHPELFTSKQVCVDVEADGALTSGVTVADWKNHWGRVAQTTVLLGVDAPGFAEVYVEAIGRLGYQSTWLARPKL
jgi:inosine-uridine nucleoside N-ribohydrolase